MCKKKKEHFLKQQSAIFLTLPMITECTCYIEGFEQWELLKDYFANTKRKSMLERIWKISEMG